MHHTLRYLPVLLLGLALPAAAGQFTASQACPAFQSMAKGTNPGNVQTVPGTAYPVLEQMQRQGQDWVRIAMPQAQPAERWVQASCGAVQDGAGSRPAAAAAGGPASCSTPDNFSSWVLALSWQPEFCADKASNSQYPECVALESGKLDVKTLTLHGLWPNNQAQCGSKYASCGNAPLALQPATRQQLDGLIPSLRWNQVLVQHEWRKHGTCQTRWDDDQYFLVAASAARLINESAFGMQIMTSTGRSLGTDELRRLLPKDYRSSVSLLCDGQNNLSEVRLTLAKDFRLDQGLPGLFGSSPLPAPGGRLCDERRPLRIDAAGR